MKKLFLLAIVIAASFTVNAQSYSTVITSTDTSTNADTVIVQVANMKSKLKAFQITVKKVSGTVGSKVYLQGTIDGSQWVNIDSLVNTDQSFNTKVVTVTATNYNSYRAWYPSTGTQKSTLTLAYLRRQDE